MQSGQVVEEGTRDEIFDSPQHPYTRRLLQAAPRLAPPAYAAPPVSLESPT
jgi:peptide/nickel transport system ATP-binding protein